MVIMETKLPAGKNARLVAYLHKTITEQTPHREKRPAVIVFPGGGYEFLSEREADPVALAFFEKGYNTFILYYSVLEQAGDMTPLSEASAAIMTIREHAKEWNVEENHIAVCGFSAGGHLAASIATLWDAPELLQKIDTKGGQNRPDAAILSYPVISAGAFSHRGSIRAVSRQAAEGSDAWNFWSLENHVSEKTPPVFLWHTVDDQIVPVENSLMFAAALQRNHIPFEAHFYPHGQHGLSVCTDEVATPDAHVGTWVSLCTQWLNILFGFSY